MKLLQPIVDKFESFTRSRKYKEGDYFTLENLNVADDYGQYGVGIRLLKGEYAGVLLGISHLAITEDLGYQGARAGFTIKIYESPFPMINNDLPLPEKLGKIVSDIVLVILEYATKKDNNEPVTVMEDNDDEDRKNYIEESVPKRTVRKKSSPILED